MSKSQPEKPDQETSRKMTRTAEKNIESEKDMAPRPQSVDWTYRAAGKLLGKTALITGGDSGIGRATAILYAREGADVAIIYLRQDEDAEETRRMVEAEGRRCLVMAGDVGE